MNLFFHIILTVVFILPSHLYAEDISNQYFNLREKEIHKFSLDLFESKEYYRTITEAKRYISAFPQGQFTEDMYKLIGDAYLMSKEWSEATRAYDEFIEKFPNSIYLNQVVFSKSICLIKKKDFRQAEYLFQDIIKRDNPQKKGESIRWRILLLIQENRFNEIDDLLNEKFIKELIGREISLIKESIDEKKRVHYKSPEVAGIMSAILPGSGQFYNERYQDGVASFVLNALFIWGAYRAFDMGNYGLGGVLAVFEVGWYTGNVYTAVNGAHKYNRKIDEDIFKKNIYRFNLLENEVRSTPGAYIIFRFPF